MSSFTIPRHWISDFMYSALMVYLEILNPFRVSSNYISIDFLCTLQSRIFIYWGETWQNFQNLLGISFFLFPFSFENILKYKCIKRIRPCHRVGELECNMGRGL